MVTNLLDTQINDQMKDSLNTLNKELQADF